MLDKDQSQTVEGGSLAQQAGRDILNIYTGPSFSDIAELCEYLWEKNFPVLREEARNIAEQHVKSFASELSNKLEASANRIDETKFSDPDVQATINDAVKACARRGEFANPSILASLITERVSTETDDYMGIVFSEAIQVVPRLTAAQISLLSLVIFVTHMGFSSLERLEDLEKWGRLALNFSEPAFGLPEGQKRHIHYAGAAMVLGKTSVIATGNLYEGKDMMYKNLCDGVNFWTAAHERAPSFARILDKYIEDKLVMVTLNSVGQAIALTNISRFFGRLDYSTWLNNNDLP